MKKYIPYIIVTLIAAAVIALLFTSNKNKSKDKVLDQRLTLRRQDKIPYGTFVAYEGIKEMFPNARLYPGKQEPGYWDSLSNYDDKQAYIFIGDKFSADEYELKRLVRFAENGNDVFISARYISADTDELLGCNSSSFDLTFISPDQLQDSMKITLREPAYTNDSVYQYPGLTFSSYFSELDTTTTDILGVDENNKPNFIHLAAGKGHFYIHLEPLAFSNYFLLHKKNMDYFENAISVVNPDVTKIVWDEYYLSKKKRNENNNEDKKGWFSVLMSMKNEDGKHPFRAAFWLLLALLLIYTLMEMRRKQRYIPVVKPPKNDSLDFVKTIGRLYYDKGDHRNLCRKMSAYFLEHVRSKYKLPTSQLDEKFIKALQYKSGVEEKELRGIISFIKYLEDSPTIDQEQLTGFYEQLEMFYKVA